MLDCLPTPSCTVRCSESFCRGCGRTVGGIAEARVHQGARDTGADVQRGEGVLDGKVSSVREQQKQRVHGLQRRIARAERQVAKAEEQSRWQQVHQKKRRRLASLRSRLAGLEADIAAGRVRLCFGSKRLWRKQHHLELNGYASREEWLKEWQDARSNEFFVLGSRDETAGCQLCVATVADDGTLTLRLRLPDCLADQHGKYLFIQGVRFAYGHEQMLAALALGSNAEYAAYRRQHGEREARGTASARPSATVSSRMTRAGGCLPPPR